MIFHRTLEQQPPVDLFGETIQKKTVLVFHDESGDYGRDDWVFTGLLWLNEERLRELDQTLKLARGDYQGEIHFADLPASFYGDFAADARVARTWMTAFKAEWAYQSWFNVLAVNRRHPGYEHRRFTRDFHAYNRFTAMAIKAGLAWHFRDVPSMQLKVFSDEKSRRPQGLLGDGFTTDNFEQYLETRILDATHSYRGPSVKLAEPINCLGCPRTGPFGAEHEVLQLVDLLLGSVAAAVEPKSNRPTKLWLGREISGLIRDTRLLPWRQRYCLHRRFSVSYFPDSHGRVHGEGQLRVDAAQNQMRMF